jgi:hypothetical protein
LNDRHSIDDRVVESKILLLNNLADQIYQCHQTIELMKPETGFSEIELAEIHGLDNMLRTIWAEVIGIRECNLVNNGK